MDDFVRWNNRVVSAKSCRYLIAGVPYVGITALDYEEKLEKELVYGADRSGSPIGMTSGKYSVSPFTITMLKDVFMKKFLPQMAILSAANLAPGSYGAGSFPLVAQYSEPPLTPDQDIISGCQIVGTKDAYQEGISALVTEISLMAMVLERNGLTLYSKLRSLV